jgi:hypothetical protein
MDQLLCRDLKPGDILLKMADQTLFNKLVILFQSCAKLPNAFIAHAALALDTQFCIEAQASGISANHLAMKDKDFGYLVYRPQNAALGRGAANAAKLLFDIHQRHGNLRYNLAGTVASLVGSRGTSKSADTMDSLLDKILAGRGHAFFCSQLVVYVYQWAGSQFSPPQTVFNISDAKVPPATLAARLVDSGRFFEAGYMLPGER